MKIAVCVKQVPASSNVKVDEVTGVLIRSSSDTKMNPYDLYGIETALQLKEKVPNTEVIALSMGPLSAEATLYEALWMGCDEAYLLSDRKFAGADVLATARALSQALRVIGDLDLIICGKQTTDGDTAQVGPEISEFLGYPLAPYVDAIIEVKEQSMVVRSNYESYYDIVEIDFPFVMTVEKDIFTPRLPSYKRKKALGQKKIHVLTLNDLPERDESLYGLSGSPTQVERIYSPEKKTQRDVIMGPVEDVTDQLLTVLLNRKFIKGDYHVENKS